MNQTQLRGASIQSQVQAQSQKVAIASQSAKQAQDVRTEQAQQISQGVKLSSKDIEELIWYPWGEKFESLPQSTKQQIERLHQEAIGGVVDRAAAKKIPTLSGVGEVKFTSEGMQYKSFTPTEKVITTQQTQVQQKDIFGRNVPTYDTSTGVYTGVRGEKMSMAKAPLGTKLTGGIYDKFNKVMSDNKIKQDLIKSETKRYKDLGYKTNEAQVLAKESIRQGGISFTPQESNIRLTQQRTGTSYNLSKEIVRYKKLGYSEKDANKLARASLSSGGVTYTKQKAQEILTPTQRYVMGITGMSMAKAKKAEGETIKKYNVSTNIRETEYYKNNSRLAGYFVGGSELEVKPVDERGKKVQLFEGSNIMITLPNFLADFGRDTSQNLTQSHEFAHKLDSMGKLNANFSFKDASKGGIDETYYKERYGKDYDKKIEGEYKAKAYENYIENPEAFAKKFPEEAKVFSSAIGYTPSIKKNIFQVFGEGIGNVATGVGDFVSLVKTTVTGVKEVSKEFGEVKKELWKAGDAVSQGGLTELNKTTSEAIDYGKKEAKKSIWNMFGMTGNVVAGTTTPTTKVTPTKETYIPSFGGQGAFVSTSPTGRSGTVYSRSPTIEEQAKIDIAQENILTINPTITQQRVRGIDTTLSDIKKLNEKIEDLEKTNVKNNEWVGSNEDYKKYTQLYNRVNIEQQRLTSKGVSISEKGNVIYPTTKAGFFGLTRDIPINEVGGTYNAIKQPFMALTGKAVESTKIETPNIFYYAGKFGEELGQVIKEPSRIKDYLVERPKYVMDLNKGTFRETTKEDLKKMSWKERGDIKPQSIWTSEEIGKGVSTATGIGIDIGVSSIPYVGTGIYAYQTTKSVGESGGIIKWVQEKPLEAGTTAFILSSSLIRGIGRKVEAKRLTKAIEQKIEDLEKYKVIGIQPRTETKFNIIAKQESDDVIRFIGGAGETNLGKSGQVSVGEIASGTVGKVKYKSLFGFPIEKEFAIVDLSKSGQKVLQSTIKQSGDITKGFSLGINLPLTSTSAIVKVGEKSSKVLRELKKNIKKTGGMEIQIEEFLSQPTKIETITKIRTPSANLLDIKIKEKPEAYFTFTKQGIIKDYSPLQQVQVLKDKFSLLIPKVNVPTITVKETKPLVVSLIESQYPTYVGGTSFLKDTGFVSASTITEENLPQAKEFSLSLTGNVVREQPKVDTGVRQFEVQTTTQTQVQKQIPKQVEMLKQRFNLSFKTNELFKEQQAVSQIQALGLKQQSKQVQKQELLTRLKLKTQPKPPQPKKPTIKVPLPLSLSFGEKKTAVEQVKDIFEVYIGKKGKERKIGEELDILKAGRRLKTGLKSGLEAGGFISGKKTGRKVRYEEVADVLGAEFRPSVSSSERIIQRKEKVGLFGSRLGSQKERSLIQISKGKKKGWF